MSVNYFLNGFMDDEFSNQMFTMENKIKENGIAERNIQVAEAMLKKSDINYVAEITGLSKEELKKMKKEMKKKDKSE